MTSRATSSPLFIGGTGRCGTTALAYAFREHKDTAKLPKSPRITSDPGGLLDLVDGISTGWDPYTADRALWEFEHFWHELRGDTHGRYQSHQMEEWIGEEAWEEAIQDLKDELIHHVTDGRWVGTHRGRNEIYEINKRHFQGATRLARLFMDRIHKPLNPNARYWIDDDPYCVTHFSDFWSIFPGMKMIHIHRHPYEVLASHLRVRFGNKMWTSGSAIANARRIRGIYETWIQELHTTRDAHVVARDVKLQDIANNPEDMIGKLCEFLGLEYDQAIADYIDPDEINNKWEREMGGVSGEEWDQIVEIFEPVADWYGYEL